MLVTEVPRIFFHEDQNDKDNKKITLPDPDRTWTPEKVLNHYTPQYPVLGTATIVRVGIEDAKEVFEFVSTIGSKS